MGGGALHPQGSRPRRRPKTSGPAPSSVRSKVSSRAWPLTVWLGISCLTSLCVPPSPLCYTKHSLAAWLEEELSAPLRRTQPSGPAKCPHHAPQVLTQGLELRVVGGFLGQGHRAGAGPGLGAIVSLLQKAAQGPSRLTLFRIKNTFNV